MPNRIAALFAAVVIAGCHRGDATNTAAVDSTKRDSSTAGMTAAAPESATTPATDTTQPPVNTAANATDTAHGTTSSGAAAGKSATAAKPASDQPPPLRDAYHTAPLDTVNAKVYAGWKYYNLNCSRCHGEDVLGTTIAPHLIMSLKPNGPIPDEGTFLSTVCGGREAKGMPAWCKQGLTTAQIDTIYSYVKGRSDAKLHPGRPALQ